MSKHYYNVKFKWNALAEWEKCVCYAESENEVREKFTRQYPFVSVTEGTSGNWFLATMNHDKRYVL